MNSAELIAAPLLAQSSLQSPAFLPQRSLVIVDRQSFVPISLVKSEPFTPLPLVKVEAVELSLPMPELAQEQPQVTFAFPTPTVGSCGQLSEQSSMESESEVDSDSQTAPMCALPAPAVAAVQRQEQRLAAPAMPRQSQSPSKVEKKSKGKAPSRSAQKRRVPEAEDFSEHTHVAYSGRMHVTVQNSKCVVCSAICADRWIIFCSAAGVWKRHSCSYTISVAVRFGDAAPVNLSATVRLYQHSAFEKLGKGERRVNICRPLKDKRAVVAFDDCERKKNVAHPKQGDDGKYDAIHQLEWRGPTAGARGKAACKGPTSTTIAFTFFTNQPVTSAQLSMFVLFLSMLMNANSEREVGQVERQRRAGR